MATTTTSATQRQRFDPRPCDGPNHSPSLAGWTPLVCCPADFPPEIFPRALLQLIEHPEYNSTLILRSEISEDTDDPDRISALQQVEGVVGIPFVQGKKAVRCIRRRLLPRRPTRDAEIEQYCAFYAPDAVDPPTGGGGGGNATTTTDAPPDTVVLTPILSDKTPSLPYYHPAVHHLAFHYYHQHPDPDPDAQSFEGTTGTPGTTTASTATTPAPASIPYIQIEVIPLPDTPTSLDSRLYRTSLALLETVHRYGWGALTDYQKRVKHDCLIEREVYQDLYLIMRERYKHLIHAWQESTDPLKHVFEDIGIATFLMLLWRFTFAGDSKPEGGNGTGCDDGAQDEPWRTWPRPPGGFLDLGCGNGLLTHILVSEGYTGFGVDLRARTSWDHYSELSREHLKVHTFHPGQHFRFGDPNSDDGDSSQETSTSTSTSTPIQDTSTTSTSTDPDASSTSSEEISTYFPPGVFIIGNHADELSPWLPLLATLHDASGYISIPCCPWAFDTKFQRGMLKGDVYPVPIPQKAEEVDFVESLNLGGGPGGATSGYSMYRIWLAALSLHCGWEIESETLRIPSTRNWALVGRKRTRDAQAQALDNVKGIFDIVERRGLYKSRKPEGKAGNGH